MDGNPWCYKLILCIMGITAAALIISFSVPDLDDGVMITPTKTFRNRAVNSGG